MSEAKKREVVQLLRDYRSFYSPFGGAALSDGVTNLQEKGSYGPAGLVFAGTEVDRSDRRRLRESLEALRKALLMLRSERRPVSRHSNGDDISGISAWSALIEPYLADPADPSVVDDWRKKARQGYISAGRSIERYDAAIETLAKYLEVVKLHVVYPRLMTEDEEQKMEHQNAEMFAVFQRLRVSGLRAHEAIAQAADYFSVSTDTVDRVLEFRQQDKPDHCSWGSCDRAPFSQNLCMKHYQQQRRGKKAS